MIQRKQSIWLLIAALCGAGLFYFSLYQYHVTENGIDVVKSLRVNDHYPSLIVAVVTTLLPLVSIFMYTNRKRQVAMSFANVMALCSFISMVLARVTGLDKLVPPPTGVSYGVGAVLPVVALIFTILAIFGIRRDDKLVKSMDRLR